MPRTIEEIIYEEMCAGCENEHYCHSTCQNCDEYEDALNERYEHQNKKPTQEELEEFWEDK